MNDQHEAPTTTTRRQPAVFARIWQAFRRNPLPIVGWLLFLLLLFAALRNLLPLGQQPAEYSPEQFLRQIIFGLAQGSIYAMLALGYTMVYSVLSIVHFAHGEVFMTGAYAGFFALSAAARVGLLESNPLLSVLLTMAAGMGAAVAVALLLERFAYRPIRESPSVVSLIVAVGASLVLQQGFVRLFGAAARRYPTVNLYAFPRLFPTYGCNATGSLCRGIDLIDGRYDISILGFNLRLLPIHAVVFVAALGFMLALWFYVARTGAGRALRSVAEDRSVAVLMGVDANRAIVGVFALGGLLAGAAGVLYAFYNHQVSPFIGFLPGIKGLTAAALGGMG
ncbi:MAG: branched-chain amino acid ABC transporter permease, partial [Anaerolineae bacterium]|nr:branched-chain amino acid ABC transporter permease [Anaerolineae bacterium]